MAAPPVDLDLDALAPKPRTVRLHGKLYKLPVLTVDQVVEFFQFEKDEEVQADPIVWLTVANERIRDLLADSNTKVPAKLGLHAGQVAAVLSNLMGTNTTATDAVKEALLAGMSDDAGAAENGAEGGDGSVTPLRSPKRSRGRS